MIVYFKYEKKIISLYLCVIDKTIDMLTKKYLSTYYIETTEHTVFCYNHFLCHKYLHSGALSDRYIT